MMEALDPPLTMAGFLFALGHLLLAVTRFCYKTGPSTYKVLKRFNVDEGRASDGHNQWFLEYGEDSQSGGIMIGDFKES